MTDDWIDYTDTYFYQYNEYYFCFVKLTLNDYIYYYFKAQPRLHGI